MPPTKNAFGRFFRSCRIALGLNLSEFCRQNGFDKGNVSRLERGLTRPPESSDLLRAYAVALQLEPNSERWAKFMRLAAIARGKLPSPVSDERAAAIVEIFQRLEMRLHDPWVKAHDLQQWSPTRDAQAHLPALIRKLVYASTELSARIEMPGGEGVQRHGWDGIVDAASKSPFVPAGISGWEISVDQRPADKAEQDFKARTKYPLGLSPSETTFVFVTSRKWDGKQKWRDEKRDLRIWKSVEVYDSSNLEAWLELAPGVDAWLAERLKRRPAGVISISDYWESLSRLCEPPLKPVVFLTSREKTGEKLREFLLGKPCVMPIACRSPTEALDFAAAYLETVKAEDAQFAMDDDDRIRVQSRTVVVKDRAVGRSRTGRRPTDSSPHASAVSISDRRRTKCGSRPRAPGPYRGRPVLEPPRGTGLASAALAIRSGFGVAQIRIRKGGCGQGGSGGGRKPLCAETLCFEDP